jgi:hypothetical protein
MKLVIIGAAALLAGSLKAYAGAEAGAAFCARLKLQTEAAKIGFKSIRGEFRAGRTATGLLVTRTYSNVELWDDTACYFGLENGDIQHSCETGFFEDDTAARLTRDALAKDLAACFGREIKGQPVVADAATHTASLALTGNRTVLLTVSAPVADGDDGKILISVRVRE